ncbi:protein kinase [Pseudomonadota bacterium]
MDISIEGYEIGEKIGRGGMAEVYRARHLRLDREVAIKLLLRHYSDDPSFAERFMREARIAAQLNHPNIVQIYDVNNFNDRLFIAMELVTNGDLSQKLLQQPNKDFAIKIFTQLCAALDYAHQKGYIHRDIKPANILFRDDDSLALSDFGIARAIRSETNLTLTGSVIGTPSYMSPEQAQGATLDSRSDLYSMAVIAYKFISGQLPYQADSSISLAIKHINEPIPLLLAPLTPMQAFFNTALAKDPKQRFPNGQAFIDAFTQALNSIDSESYTEFTTQLLDNRGSDANAVTLTNPAQATIPVYTATSPTNAATAGGVIRPAPNTKPGASTSKLSLLKSQGVRLLGIGLVLAVLASLGWQLINPAADEPKQLSPAEQARLTYLLSEVDQAMLEDRLISPKGDNAYEHFLGIMTLSPNDPVALDGIQKINQRLIGRGEKFLAQDNLPAAENLITRMQSHSIDPSTYSDLKTKLEAARQRQLQLADLVQTDIEKYLNADNVNAALNKYKTINIQELTPEQQATIEQLLAKKSTMLINQAQRSLEANQLSDAQQSLDQAGNIATALGDTKTANQVAALQNKVDVKETQLNRNRQFQGMISAGNKALRNGHLLKPESKNAWHYFNQALRTKPNDKQALEGIKNVKQALHDKISAATDTGNVKLAETTIKALTRIDAHYPELRQLRRNVALKEREIKRAVQNQQRIKELFSRAQTYLNREKANSADKIWHQITELEPNHPDLTALSKQIADGYVILAQKEIDAKDWDDVNVWVERGLKHVPNHQRLLEQRKLAEEKIKAGCNSLFKKC